MKKVEYQEESKSPGRNLSKPLTALFRVPKSGIERKIKGKSKKGKESQAAL
jgi:hypothetical protein